VPAPDMNAEARLVRAVPHQLLVQTMASMPALPAGTPWQNSRNIYIAESVLYNATYDTETKDDIPVLLTDKTGEGLVMVVNKKWQDEPPVVTFLLDALAQFQATTPGDFSSLLNGQILELAVDCSDPKVASALADLVNKAAHDREASQSFLYTLAFRCAHSSNAASQNHLIVLFSTLTPEKAMLDVLRTAVTMPHTALLTNPDFTTPVLEKLQSLSETPYADLLLAYLGNTRGFTRTVTAYFNLAPESEEPEPHNSQGLSPALLAITRKQFLGTVLYSGPGDKLEGIKKNYAAATYQNGLWTVPASP